MDINLKTKEVLNINGSVAEGEGSTASGAFSHAEGGYTVAAGDFSHAEGQGMYDDSDFWTVSGPANSTVYTTDGSLTEGDIISLEDDEGNPIPDTVRHVVIVDTDSFTVDRTFDANNAIQGKTIRVWYQAAYGNYSHSEGTETKAIGDNGHAEGSHTIAYSTNSHAEGYGTVAGESCSHSEGSYTKAFGANSHAEGSQAIARSTSSHAEGFNTETRCQSEHAEGQYNVSNSATTQYGSSGNTQHSVGIGTSDSDRKNAFEIMQNGDAYLYGVGGYDGTNQETADTIAETFDKKATGDGITTIKSLTQAQYDALVTKDSQTFYVIV